MEAIEEVSQSLEGQNLSPTLRKECLCHMVRR